MRQRVCIAMALACGPRLLFADELTTALDVTVQHQILNLLAEQQRDRAMGMVLVTHDLGVVAGRTDEIVVMYAGRAVERAPTTTLFAEMRHPYTEGLLRSIPKTSEAKHTCLNAIHGRPPDPLSPPPGCKFAPRLSLRTGTVLERGTTAHRSRDARALVPCFYPIGTPENRAAYESNCGRPAAPRSCRTAAATEEVA
ncbi:MAG: hypothetical protein R2713_20930 [Ilumatobacteraceae bacterium]